MSTKKEGKKSPDGVMDIIDLCESEEEKDLAPLRKRLKTQYGATKVKTEGVARMPGSMIGIDDDDDDDDIQVVEKASLPDFQSNAKTTGDEEVQLVGFIGDKLPHVRCHCPDNMFVNCSVHSPNHMVRAALESNQKTCDLCYCYVCDKPASDCTKWAPAERGSVMNDTSHCMAVDKGADAATWKRMRERAKNPNYGVNTSSPRFGIMSLGMGDSNTSSQTLPPDHVFASTSESFTKCRKCSWYTRLDVRIATLSNSAVSPSCNQWCKKCGRVASDKFMTRKMEPYKRMPLDVFLGQKEITFTMHAHDPRKMKDYQKSWEENGETWTYNEAEMQDDAFRHRFGNFVLPGHILRNVSVLPLEKIPVDGSLESPRSFTHYRESKVVSISETEAVVLDSQEDLVFLRELDMFDSFGLNKVLNSPLVGHIQAAWDKASQKGAFTVSLYLRPGVNCRSDKCSLTKLLGAWFGVAPFTLSSLGHAFTAAQASKVGRYDDLRLPVPPFRLSLDEEDSHRNEMADEIQEAMDSFNTAVEANRSKRALTSSCGEFWVGGTAGSSPGGFRSFLQRYYSEVLVDDILSHQASHSRDGEEWLLRKFGAVSSHRRMRCAGSTGHDTLVLRHNRGFDDTHFHGYLANDDHPLAAENLSSQALKIKNRMTSLHNLMQHMENLGHGSIENVDGLSVDLLPFQKQSVQWALERERKGAQSFLWAELPHVEDRNVDKLYLNPILNRIERKKPKLIRGGLLCEEMGLGKTIISLAMILANPAPELPLSGSPVPDTFTQAGEELGWDPDLKTSMADQLGNGKRGSILSRGTLVVCHVSLVGQWCEEAKSKLQDPGLIYPYHGGGRKRDAKLLAQNSIVVTTYATLSSDANYHRNRAEDIEGYCPPCEQVRWWRIICDESHTMRSANTKQSRATLDLVSDHTWAVTGTPISTSINDLSNQLRLIGFEDVSDYFSIFRKTVMLLVNDRENKRGRGRGSYSCSEDKKMGKFLFFMRNLMIRHTKHQKYAGTDTELMALPPKTERTVEVALTEEERTEYTALENEAKEFYLSFKASCKKELSKYYLQLSSALKIQRCACSGGRYPLTPLEGAPKEVLPNNSDDDDSDDEIEEQKGKKKKKVIEFSDFAFTSKLKVLITELTRIRDEEPGSKSLIFSNFSSTLEWLREELPKHGFTFRHINGQMPQKKRAAALAAFQNDPPTTVFLLSMRSSNCGINLTSANRVFLLEPAMNPAAVQQAIGRVHRLGQKRNVEIIRMVVANSIETRLTKMLEQRYGSGPTPKDDDKTEEDGDDDEDKKPAAKPVAKPAPVEAFVGNLSTDKATVLAKEFDLLFGVADSNDHGGSSDSEDEEMGHDDLAALGEDATSGMF